MKRILNHTKAFYCGVGVLLYTQFAVCFFDFSHDGLL